MSQRALITGGTGFIGSRLVERLVEEGWSVDCLCLPGTQGTLEHLHGDLRLHEVTGDDRALRAQVLDAHPDTVFHLASVFRAEHTPEDVTPLVVSNVLFATQVLDAATASGCKRLVNIGTSWQHYDDADYDPVCLYAATKQAFQDIARYYVSARSLSVVTLEFFDTYGPGDDRPKLVPALIDLCVKGGRLSLSAGEQQVDMVFVEDVVDAVAGAAERLFAADQRGPAVAESFTVESGERLTLRELVSLIERLCGRSLDVGWGERTYRQREVMTPWSRGRCLPGWSPRVTLHEGLARTLRAAGCPCQKDSEV
jgi:nucleoside-diphosphate-sugar epimerase